MFRGREMVHQEYGRKLLDRMAEELRELAAVERNPLVEGRNMTMIMSPMHRKPSRPALPHADDGTEPGPAVAESGDEGDGADAQDPQP
jgi:translation initiation factor IF-3